MSWQNEVFDDELQLWANNWLDEENVTMERTQDKISSSFDKSKGEFNSGCKVCGTLTGIHGFSFDRTNSSKDG